MFGEEFRELEESFGTQCVDLIIRGSTAASRETKMVTSSVEQTWADVGRKLNCLPR